MSDKPTQSNIPQQWRIESVKGRTVAFNCPACQEHFSFNAGVFEKNSNEKIEGLTKTDQSVYRSYGQNILAFILALVVYYYAHQWINGEGVPLNQGILIPVFIAVFAYSILKPLLSVPIFSGKGMAIYTYQCTQCQTDVFIACDGKSTALPVTAQSAGSSSPAGTGTIQSTPLETPCNVSITRLPGMIGAAMGVDVFLNGAEIGNLQNGKTLDFATKNSANELTVKYRADGSTNSLTFNAESGGSVRITLKYSGAILSVT
jgi:hypothetical protein